jgi:NACHT domain
MTSSAIIEHIRALCDANASYLAYFFFDFKDVAKQDNRALLSSLLTQLSTKSDTCFEKLFHTYSNHNDGSQQPSERALLQCLKDMLVDLGHAPIYIIVDAVDECPNTSKAPGAPRSRREVLDTIKELVKLHLPNLHICVTSRPEVDIRNAVKQVAACLIVPLHDQDGQKNDIATYVRSVVYSDREELMNKWGSELKERVVETLSSKADGM